MCSNALRSELTNFIAWVFIPISNLNKLFCTLNCTLKVERFLIFDCLKLFSTQIFCQQVVSWLKYFLVFLHNFSNKQFLKIGLNDKFIGSDRIALKISISIIFGKISKKII